MIGDEGGGGGKGMGFVKYIFEFSDRGRSFVVFF